MARTITETHEDLNSVEVTRDAKGAFKFTVKIYFSNGDDCQAANRVEGLMTALRHRFEPEATNGNTH